MLPFSHTARLTAAAALLLAAAGAIPPPAAATIARATDPAYPAAQATPVPFELPAAPGETDVEHDTGAGQSVSTVDMAPGETGTLEQIPPEFLDDQ